MAVSASLLFFQHSNPPEFLKHDLIQSPPAGDHACHTHSVDAIAAVARANHSPSRFCPEAG
jgi:hypothetical protein